MFTYQMEKILTQHINQILVKIENSDLISIQNFEIEQIGHNMFKVRLLTPIFNKSIVYDERNEYYDPIKVKCTYDDPSSYIDVKCVFDDKHHVIYIEKSELALSDEASHDVELLYDENTSTEQWRVNNQYVQEVLDTYEYLDFKRLFENVGRPHIKSFEINI